MKTALCILVGCVLMNGYSFACGDGGCQQSANACGNSVSINHCQCTDPNYASNPCLSINQYCEAFGNIGGMDEDP